MNSEELAKLMVDDHLADFDVDLHDYMLSEDVNRATAKAAAEIARGIADTLRQRLDDE